MMLSWSSPPSMASVRLSRGRVAAWVSWRGPAGQKRAAGSSADVPPLDSRQVALDQRQLDKVDELGADVRRLFCRLGLGAGVSLGLGLAFARLFSCCGEATRGGRWAASGLPCKP